MIIDRRIRLAASTRCVDRPVRVLHISEAFGGGVTTALCSFASNSPEIDHHLLATVRENDKIDKDLESRFRSVRMMPGGLLASIRSIEQAYKELQPDWVHLHSSFAGLYGRLTRIPTSRIIYSPHGFAFERSSSPAIVRVGYRIAETILARRHSRFAGVSHYEVRSAERMNVRAKGYFVPNSTESDSPEVKTRDVPNEGFTVVCVGRLSAQKDPDFLARCVETLNKYSRPGIKFQWIGGGDEAEESKLRALGVDVTGWVSHEEVLERLADADLYFHTAAWEGFPMTVVEAATLGCPLLLRGINALEGFGFPRGSVVATPEEAAWTLARLAERRRHQWDLLDRASGIVRNVCTGQNQGIGLMELYRR
jgi:glycosyltransferase involved in cell wall biosynthesis